MGSNYSCGTPRALRYICDRHAQSGLVDVETMPSRLDERLCRMSSFYPPDRINLILRLIATAIRPETQTLKDAPGCQGVDTNPLPLVCVFVPRGFHAKRVGTRAAASHATQMRATHATLRRGASLVRWHRLQRGTPASLRACPHGSTPQQSPRSPMRVLDAVLWRDLRLLNAPTCSL